ncbi:DUF2125 domain-containing protein [Roseospirillum parvum]|uniref:DUF2125 domain-containing protein n=1 Tax=Roseospirillum parvum TaxID=83401 RepID=A0A1G8BSJ4_9PROT|nr:DUF2125 domain-containing protein [Roseospirillum parvum]SDH36099.1 hypothetical protein SAMN05421742_106109 [Roseospirillum parvum]
MASRRVMTLLSLPLSAAVLAAAYGAFWFMIASSAEEEITAWFDARAAEGYRVTRGTLAREGFPGPVRLRLSGAAIEVANPRRGAVVFEGFAPETVTVTVEPWAPTTTIVSLPGRQQVSFSVNGRSRVATITGNTLTALVESGGRGLAGLTVDLQQVAVRGALGGGETFTLARLDGRLTALASEVPQPAADTPTWRLGLQLADLDLPPQAGLPLGSRLDNLDLDARLLGPLPALPVGEAVNAWREAGGTLEVDRLSLDWPPLDVLTEGTLALDDFMQPEGALTARVRGFFEAVDSLAARGVVRSRDASMARIVLGVLAKRPPGGGPPELKVPVTLQQQMLYVGPMPLLALPTIRWGYHLQRNRGDIRPGFEIGPEGEIIRDPR